MPINKPTQRTTAKLGARKNANDEVTPPPITTKTGKLRYKEAARQVRQMEKSNKALSATCHLGINESLKNKRKPQVQPAIVEIKGLFGSHVTRREKCLDTSQSTIMSSKTETFSRQHPWNKVPCTDLKIFRTPSSQSPSTKGPASFSERSNYQGWIDTVPICIKSETTTSQSGQAATNVAEFAKQTKDQQKEKTKIEQINSQELKDSDHIPSQEVKPTKFTGAQWHKPCKASVVAGAPQRYVGTCLPSLEQISKMSKARQKFFLTQDPRRTHCLVNPDFLRSKTISEKKEFSTFTKMVKTAENVCTGKEVEKAESILCETLDPENPLNLDFQGLDYKNTYEGDEQDFQNLRLYRRLCRHMDRKRAKVETQEKVEEELQNERLAVPARFAIKNRHEVIIEPSEESIKFGKLYRSTDKPSNQQRIQDELKNRRDRYKDLYLRNKERQEAEAKAEAAEEEAAAELLGATVAQRNFDEAVENIDDAIKLAVQGEELLKREEVPRRRYPHTIRETRVFKQKLKQNNRIKHDRALVKQEFYREHLAKQKDYPELHCDYGGDTKECELKVHENSQSESSDDEDDIEVGKVGDQFMLRGFHFKLGDNLRGKIHQREKYTGPRKEKGCISRDQWLNELAPKKRQVKLDVEVGIIKLRNPDDPNYELFPPERGLLMPKTKKSAVKDFVQHRLGRHYERQIRSKLKTKMPRLPYHVKKFNLIRFLYSENDRRLEALRAEELKDSTTFQPLNSTIEYIEERDMQRKEAKEMQKRERMQLLGIPCVEPITKSSQVKCEPSDTETDSDWVPDREPDVEGNLAEYEQRMAAGNTFEKLTNDIVGNMPAPEYREGTLRRHPRHPRDYAKLRVPSVQFDDAVKTSGIPHMRKLEPDVRLYENVKLPKRAYTKKFEARHHHDHWNPIQTTTIDVHYQPKIIKADVTKEHLSKEEAKALQSIFEKANPECKEYVKQDLATIKYDMDAIIAQFREERKKTGTDRGKELVVDICQQREYAFHSRDPAELENVDYPGRQEYLDFLNEIRATLEEKKKAVEEEGEQHLCIDEIAYIEELEADLKSIESCLTSNSSSVCTNLTNDSGSFLLMEGTTKVPLDYIRKSVVPFEELQRSRFKAVSIDCDKEEANPFRILPFSGQKRAQVAMTAAKDSFFTFTTRLRNGMRLRLETPIIDVRKTLIGRGAQKYPGAVTTDIDENYVTELKNRPSVKYFHFKSGRDFVKNALRLKFESMVIQGQIVRAKIYDRLNELHWQAMQKTKALYEKLFAKWEKREYETAMSVVYKVKTFYEITDTLRSEFRELDRQQTVLNMDIVFIEGIWIRRVMLQNFHYLLGDREWRYEYDWIHRVPVENPADEADSERVNYELEGFAESIANRSKVNVRNRDKDDAWAIKSYYEDVYLPNKQPILIVFPDADSFLNGIENLKLKTFMLLLELHFTMSVHTELQGRLETFEEWCMQELKEKEEYVMRKCSKKYFMEDRADELKRRTLDYLDEPIENSYNDPNFNRDRAVISEVWRQIVPATQRGAGNQDIDPCDMVAMMSDVVVNLIAAFEAIPSQESRQIETHLRRRRAYLRKLSRNAYQTESRIDLEMKKVRRNLEPPYEKPKRVGKLKRTYLKKKIVREVVPEVHISEHTKFFFRAFHDEGDVMQMGDARDSIMDVNNMQDQIVPFYFDHFLKLNGYSVNYNFKTQVEMRDGAEIDRFQVRGLLPEVLEKIERWENIRKKTMEDNIARNPKMYENVNF